MSKLSELNTMLGSVANIAKDLHFKSTENDNEWILCERAAIVGGVTLDKVKVTKLSLRDRQSRTQTYKDAYKAWGLIHVPDRDTGGRWEEFPIQYTNTLPEAVAILVSRYLAMTLSNRGMADQIYFSDRRYTA